MGAGAEVIGLWAMIPIAVGLVSRQALIGGGWGVLSAVTWFLTSAAGERLFDSAEGAVLFAHVVTIAVCSLGCWHMTSIRQREEDLERAQGSASGSNAI